MTKDVKGGVTPPVIGKFTGRLRTPISVFAGFFVLGIVADMFMELIDHATNWTKGKRVWIGFRFWALVPDEDTYTYEEHDARETLSLDDIVLLIITVALFFLYKIRWKLRILATGGFFFGWYFSSMYISPYIEKPPSGNSATEGM